MSEEEDDMKETVEKMEQKMRELEAKLNIGRPQHIPPSVPVPRFNGSGDFYSFLRHFNVYATAANWAPVDACRMLPLFLEGDALQCYLGLEEAKKTTWKDLTAALAEKVTNHDPKTTARRALAKIRMKGEAIVEFANRVRELVEQAMPDPHFSEIARGESARDYFIEGLPTPIKKKLFFMPKPKNLLEAIEMAKKVLHLKKELETEVIASVEMEEMRAEINAISRELKKKEGEEKRGGWEQRGREWEQGGNRPQGSRWLPNPSWQGQNNDPRAGNWSYGYRGRGNANFEPLRQRRLIGSYGRANYEQEDRRNRGNDNFRGNRGGRGGNRQQYRVNAVEGSEITVSKTRLPSASTFLPFLTICTIFCITQAQYQICSDHLPSIPVQFPEIPPCELPEVEKRVERKVTLYLPVTVPKYFPIYSCQRKIFEGCTQTTFIFWGEITKSAPTFYAVSPQECEQFLEQRDKTLIRLDEYKWGTRNPEEYEYAAFGEKCKLSTNVYIEKGEGGILSGELLTSWGDNLNPYNGYEVLRNRTVIWRVPDESYYFTHLASGEYNAEITEKVIVIEEIEAAFEFEEGETDGVLGVPETARGLTNDAFAVIHNQEKVELRPKRQTNGEKRSPSTREKPEKKSPGVRTKATEVVPTVTTTITVTTVGTTSTVPTTVKTTTMPITKAPSTVPRASTTTTVTSSKPPSTVSTAGAATTAPNPVTTAMVKVKTLVESDPAKVENIRPTPDQSFRHEIRVNESHQTAQFYQIRGIREGEYPGKAPYPSRGQENKVKEVEEREGIEFETKSTDKEGVRSGMSRGMSDPGTEQLGKARGIGRDIERMNTEFEEEIMYDIDHNRDGESEELVDREDEEEEEGEGREKRMTTRATEISYIGGQEMRNTNTRINYAIQRLSEQRKREYDQIFMRVCENTRFQLQLARSILRINPTEGARGLFNRDDIIGKWTDRGLEIGFCAQATPDQIYWGNNVSDACFEGRPVKMGRDLMFIKPGTRELVFESKRVPCNEKGGMKMTNDSEIKSVMSMGENLMEMKPKYRNMENPFLMKKGPIYDSEMERVERALKEVKERMNILPAGTLRNLKPPNVTEAIELAKKELKERAVIVEDATKIVEQIMSLPEKAREAWNWVKSLVWIIPTLSLIIIGGVVLFCLVKTRVYWMVGFRMGRIIARAIGWFFRGKEKQIKVAAVPAEDIELCVIEPTAPPEPIEEKAYILSYLPPRVLMITNDAETLPAIQLMIENYPVKALIDTCAGISLCRESLAKRLGLNIYRTGVRACRAANKSVMEMIGRTYAKVRVKEKSWMLEMLVAVDEHCPEDMLIGKPALRQLEGIVDLAEEKVKLGGEWVPILAISTEVPLVTLEKEQILDPRSDTLLMGKLNMKVDSNETFLTTGVNHRIEMLSVGKTLVQPGDSGEIPLRLLNAGNSPLKIPANMTLATLEPVYLEQPKVMKVDNQEEYDSPEAKWWEKFPGPMTEGHAATNKISDKIDFQGCGLPDKYKQKLKEIVDANEEAFVGEDGRIGLYKGSLVHKIDLVPGSKPFSHRPYRYAPELQKEVERQIRNMEKEGIIAQSDSDFASPIVLVPKVDGSMRFAVDYRSLNRITEKKVYHLPLISQLLETVGPKKFYTTLDLQSGYHQIPLRKRDMHKTAFISHCGLYHFLRLPFGLCSAGHTFQKVMDQMRRDLTCCVLCYLDDLIVGSETAEQHLEDLESVFKVMIKAGLKLRLDKCSFAQSEIKYLGHILSENGVRADPKQLEAVQRFKQPTTLPELRSLIGALSYFRKYVPRFAHIIRPLTLLLKKDKQGRVQDQWTDEHDQSLQILKFLLSSPPVLGSPRFDEPFEIETDASKVAVSAVLIQRRRPIAFASRTLTPGEQNKHCNELEALALAYAVNEFKPYIWGGPNMTTMWTDNISLCAIKNKEGWPGKLKKYQLILMAYNIDVKHRSGRSNWLCDYMSRYLDWKVEVGKEREKHVPKNEEKDEKEINQIGVEGEGGIRPKGIRPKLKLMDIAAKQKGIKLLAQIYRAKKWKKFPEKDEERQLLKKILKDYKLEEGALYFKKEKDLSGVWKLVVPYELRKRAIEEMHDDIMQGGHLGEAKTLEKMAKRYWWDGVEEDVKEYIRSCTVCQKRKIFPNNKRAVPSHPIVPPKSPFQRVHTDILGPLKETGQGNRYVLATIDSFSKWVVATPMKRQDAEAVAEAFIREVILQHSVPSTVVTDQGRQFVSVVFQELAEWMGFEHKYVTAYHQSANGQIEGWNRIIANILAGKDKDTDWDRVLGYGVFAYNTSVHSSTQQSPFFTIYLREARMPTDLFIRRKMSGEGEEDGVGEERDFSWFTENRMRQAEQGWKEVREEIQKAQEGQKHWNDETRKAEERVFQIGQLVLLLKEGSYQRDKLGEKWSGPFRVIGMEEDRSNLIIKELEGEKAKKVHMEKCKAFRDACVLPLRASDTPLSTQFWADPNLEESDGEESGEKDRSNGEEEKGAEEEEKEEEEPMLALIGGGREGHEGEDEETDEQDEEAPISRQEEETEVIIEGKRQQALTRWKGWSPTVSLIPPELVDDSWEVYRGDWIEEEGDWLRDFVWMKFGGIWMQFYVFRGIEKVVMGSGDIMEICAKWKWSVPWKGRSYFWEEVMTEDGSERRREVRVPEFQVEKRRWMIETREWLNAMRGGGGEPKEETEIRVDGRSYLALISWREEWISASVIPAWMIEKDWKVEEIVLKWDGGEDRRKFVKARVEQNEVIFQILEEADRMILGSGLQRLLSDASHDVTQEGGRTVYWEWIAERRCYRRKAPAFCIQKKGEESQWSEEKEAEEEEEEEPKRKEEEHQRGGTIAMVYGATSGYWTESDRSWSEEEPEDEEEQEWKKVEPKRSNRRNPIPVTNVFACKSKRGEEGRKLEEEERHQKEEKELEQNIGKKEERLKRARKRRAEKRRDGREAKRKNEGEGRRMELEEAEDVAQIPYTMREEGWDVREGRSILIKQEDEWELAAEYVRVKMGGRFWKFYLTGARECTMGREFEEWVRTHREKKLEIRIMKKVNRWKEVREILQERQKSDYRERQQRLERGMDV